MEEDFLVDISIMAFMEPFSLMWSYLSVPDFVNMCSVRSDISDVELSGHVANEIFSGFDMPLIFDDEMSYPLRDTLQQLQKYYLEAHPRKSFLAPMSPSGDVNDNAAAAEEYTEEEVIFTIERAFEKNSYDEFDDFAPRHPMPKDNLHRRGDSYFNSDIADVARAAQQEAEINAHLGILKEISSQTVGHVPSFYSPSASFK
jgi:hypothetical protein